MGYVLFMNYKFAMNLDMLCGTHIDRIFFFDDVEKQLCGLFTHLVRTFFNRCNRFVIKIRKERQVTESCKIDFIHLSWKFLFKIFDSIKTNVILESKNP